MQNEVKSLEFDINVLAFAKYIKFTVGRFIQFTLSNNLITGEFPKASCCFNRDAGRCGRHFTWRAHNCNQPNMLNSRSISLPWTTTGE